MMIYKNSKKGGFALGSNKLSMQAIKAGGLTAVIAVLFAIALGAFEKKSKNKKSLLILTALIPTVFSYIKAHIQNEEILKFVESYASREGDDSGIEVIYAEPISSEEEIYEHIK